jgi:alkanesulfonate monooxygenase SsuD/methylene tetrahydromethanopterin reductase-like flavin-dependent oxidoreductase (luciferase family)
VGALGDHLEVITRMLAPGRATYQGRYASVDGAINIPKGVQPHIPVIVGGNGRDRIAGYAVRYADELNFVFRGPAWVADRMTEVRERCQREGRDPSTLRFSVYVSDEDLREPGEARADLLAGYAAAGVDRLACFPGRWDTSVEAQERFAQDCEAAGIALDGA